MTEMEHRALDVEVAEVVFGWVEIGYNEEGDLLYRTPDGDVQSHRWDLPRYSTLIADAWQVVEHVQQTGETCCWISSKHLAQFCIGNPSAENEHLQRLAGSLQEAICRTALEWARRRAATS